MASLAEVFSALFPRSRLRSDPFAEAPLLPADVFAFAAHVLERSGAYHHVVPEVQRRSSRARELRVGDAMRRRVRRIGRAWREAGRPTRRLLPVPPSVVNRLWVSLEPYRHEQVFGQIMDRVPAPKWWWICLELMLIADEASAGIGFDSRNVFAHPIHAGYTIEDLSTGRVFSRIQRAPSSLSTASQDIVCVQAKSRTASVGCTLRSLSHHLALLPPRGQVRARWVLPPIMDEKSKPLDELGLLLVPFPYRIGDDAFVSSGTPSDGRWGWFRVRQSWLPSPSNITRRRQFVRYVQNLVTEARMQGKRVDGVVLPELALDFDQFRRLSRALVVDRHIDFVICGVSQDANGRSGNFVAVAPFFLMGTDKVRDRNSLDQLILVREKHHRWKLDRTQIDAYNINLSTAHSWWEDLAILSRSLDMLVYRGDTTITTLICEDLARVDPCQAVVRAVGPNLLIALLMDGPQLGGRWPGRYATVLADDPGTSVLSFTSFGLIARQNDKAQFPQASAIGLWKDELNGVRSLELPREGDALLLTLNSVVKNEHTIRRCSRKATRISVSRVHSRSTVKTNVD